MTEAARHIAAIRTATDALERLTATPAPTPKPPGKRAPKRRSTKAAELDTAFLDWFAPYCLNGPAPMRLSDVAGFLGTTKAGASQRRRHLIATGQLVQTEPDRWTLP